MPVCVAVSIAARNFGTSSMKIARSQIRERRFWIPRIETEEHSDLRSPFPAVRH